MRPLLIACALLLSARAHAQDYAHAPDVAGHRLGNGGEARASMDVRAPPAAVWGVLADCANARRYIADLLSCRVLERGPGWEVREHRLRGWVLRPVLRNVARITLEPNRRFAFTRIGGDWSRSEGEWVLTPIDDGRGTHVVYRVEAALDGGFLPPGLTQAALVRTVRETLVKLRREAERRAAASPAAPRGAF